MHITYKWKIKLTAIFAPKQLHMLIIIIKIDTIILQKHYAHKLF
jgi:hypothetical protein